MKEKVVIVGGGGHAKVIIDTIRQQSAYEVAGFVDTSSKKALLDAPKLGSDTELLTLFQSGLVLAFIAVGDNMLRKKLFNKVRDIGFTCINVISPNAYVAPSVTLGEGIAVMPGAVINAASTLENNVIVNTGATIDHDNHIHAHAHIAPGCHLAGGIDVEEGAFLGTGCGVIPNKKIGRWSVIGAGATVIDHIGDYTKSAGVPAKKIGSTKGDGNE
ncbi:acetyltransferase [Tuberibacillus sp. Marseille-P3662]|uniref:acetyltransferase n=1 Tax=Tuberibacillus sp. Marseille-P3662 TaxID=1965358 RepID=UPI000A1C98F3|nr:acetyltransferase [Tuberibacillus sp. Marseille-P3662]